MSCNSCAKGFTFLRQEKGCPSCGFSYCSKCLNNKIFVPKLNAAAKVCSKCSRVTAESKPQNEVIPPDAYYKRLANANINTNTAPDCKNDEIESRLNKLKEGNQPVKMSTEEEIANRLQSLKGDVPTTSDAELQERLARLRGVPIAAVQTKPVLPVQDLRTEQEQADDLIKQYLEQTQIDTKYKDEFDSIIGDMESRMRQLKETGGPSGSEIKPDVVPSTASTNIEQEDEEESVRKIVEKLKAEALMENDEIAPSTNDELPFCEICNEDATLRCRGCRYLFCKRCFLDHRDDDDGCNAYDPYQPPKGSQY